MRDLKFGLEQLCRRNRAGIYATQRDRELDLMAGQLQELGYRYPGYHRPLRVQQRRGRMRRAVDTCWFWQY